MSAPQNTPLTVALVGGSGFIGRAVMRQLIGQGHSVRLLSRTTPAFPLPANVTWFYANTAHPDTLIPHLSNCHAVVHLVAVLAERGTPFTTTITQSAAHTAQAARAAGVPHFVYISALGASPTSPSRYAQAKAMAESAVRNAYPTATLLRPSLVIGNGGGFRQQIEQLTRHLPLMVLPGLGRSRFQPIDLTTLATLIAHHTMKPSTQPLTLNAVGPQVLSFRQITRTELSLLHRRRLLLPLPWWATWAVAYLFQAADSLTRHRLIPAWLLVTPDQVRLLQQENIENTDS